MGGDIRYVMECIQFEFDTCQTGGLRVITRSRRFQQVRFQRHSLNIYIYNSPIYSPATSRSSINISCLDSCGTQLSHHFCRGLPKVALEFTTELSRALISHLVSRDVGSHILLHH